MFEVVSNSAGTCWIASCLGANTSLVDRSFFLSPTNRSLFWRQFLSKPAIQPRSTSPIPQLYHPSCLDTRRPFGKPSPRKISRSCPDPTTRAHGISRPQDTSRVLHISSTQLFKSLIRVQDFRGFCTLNVQNLQAPAYPSAPAFLISTFLLIFSDRGYDENTPSLLSLSAMRPPVTTLMRSPRRSSRAGQHVDDQPPTSFSKANTDAPPQHAHTQEPHAVRSHPLDAPMRATSRVAVPAVLKKWHSTVFADNAYSVLTGGIACSSFLIYGSRDAWRVRREVARSWAFQTPSDYTWTLYSDTPTARLGAELKTNKQTNMRGNRWRRAAPRAVEQVQHSLVYGGTKAARDRRETTTADVEGEDESESDDESELSSDSEGKNLFYYGKSSYIL
ncbi:hypothetical protein B0H11DRAFT_1932095 [Mycena galericulata]|nr:hypothetical protein B0H11DRAFT_1932095 [Mycena galericulata]